MCHPLLPGDEGRRCGLRTQSSKGARRRRAPNVERREGGRARSEQRGETSEKRSERDEKRGGRRVDG